MAKHNNLVKTYLSKYNNSNFFHMQLFYKFVYSTVFIKPSTQENIL